MYVYDGQRRKIPLGDTIARNEDSVIYRVPDNTMFIVKLYRDPNEERKQKITWMVKNPPYDPNQTCGHTSIAWPRWMLYNDQGEWIGYVLDYIQHNRTMREVFDPELRARNHFDERYIYRSARYLASSLHAIHTAETSYVVGNLNPDDILVTPTSRITIIAMDSIQVMETRNDKTIRHPARTGKTGYMPPEWFHQRSTNAPLQPEHDLFALAVIIFQLLMHGHHPFDGQWQGPGNPPNLDERIRQGMFPYAETTSAGLTPPSSELFQTLPPELRELMRRCFCDGHTDPSRRPSAAEWEETIAQAEQQLVVCRQGHVYAQHLAVCPTCGATVADEKALRQFRQQAPEPAPVCEPQLPVSSRPSFWVWTMVASVVVLVVVMLLLGTPPLGG